MKVLYKIKSGSFLYGLTTPKSDLDYVGVYIEDTLEELLDPFNNKDEIDVSIKAKLENGKNSSEAIDEKYFHIKKFIKLCADCNPNIIEMLFAPEYAIEYVDPDFKTLFLDRPEMFVNAKLVDRFIGYAKSQEQKSYTKSNNYVTLDAFKIGLKNLDDKLNMNWIMNDSEFQKKFEGRYSIVTKRHTATNIEDVLEIADMQFPSGLTIKNALTQIEERFARASHRVEGILVNNYEPKFMSHTIRLLAEGKQLLQSRSIKFPFEGEERELIMNIKTGVIKVEDIPEIVNRYKDELSTLEQVESCNIPKEADKVAIAKSYSRLVLKKYEIYWEDWKWMKN